MITSFASGNPAFNSTLHFGSYLPIFREAFKKPDNITEIPITRNGKSTVDGPSEKTVQEAVQKDFEEKIQNLRTKPRGQFIIGRLPGDGGFVIDMLKTRAIAIRQNPGNRIGLYACYENGACVVLDKSGQKREYLPPVKGSQIEPGDTLLIAVEQLSTTPNRWEAISLTIPD